MSNFVVRKQLDGVRADIFVAKKFPQFARSALSKLFDGRVLVDEKPAKPGQKLKSGSKVSIDTRLITSPIADIDLPVLFEDDDVIAINKPAGVLTHSTGGLSKEPSVASFLRSYITDSSLSGDRAGVVHRLDRATSGVIIGAKNSKSLAALQKQFATRKAGKVYLAIAEGVPELAVGVIDVPIARDSRQPKKFKPQPNGKPAQTTYRVLSRFNRGGKAYSVLELTPKTGRTHQLRVHMAHIGHPVAGDGLYGTGDTAPRLMLHASELRLRLPSGEEKIFKAPPPQEFHDFARQ